MNAAAADLCPLCLELRAVNGSCSCDGDGVPPSAWCAWPRPLLIRVGGRRVGRARRVQVNLDALNGTPLAAGSCVCGRPTRDHAYVCVDCLVSLAGLLERLPRVMVDLDARLTASIRGIDYRAWAEPRGAGDDYRPGALPAPDRAWLRSVAGDNGTANPTALPILPHAVDARSELVSGVRWLVAMSLQAQLTPDPARSVVDVSTWLLARVDAMALHPAFADAPGTLDHLVEKALKSVAPYVGRDEARGLDAVNRDALMTRAFTASEIAAVTVSVGELDGTHTRDTTALRERIRTTVNDWHRRGRITPVSWTEDTRPRPRFRFGEVHLLLLRAPAPRPAARPAPIPARPGLDGLADWPTQPTKETR